MKNIIIFIFAIFLAWTAKAQTFEFRCITTATELSDIYSNSTTIGETLPPLLMGAAEDAWESGDFDIKKDFIASLAGNGYVFNDIIYSDYSDLWWFRFTKITNIDIPPQDDSLSLGDQDKDEYIAYCIWIIKNIYPHK